MLTPAAFSVAALVAVAWRTPSQGPAGVVVAAAVGAGDGLAVGGGVPVADGTEVGSGVAVLDGCGDGDGDAEDASEGDGDGEGEGCPCVAGARRPEVASLAATGRAVDRVPLPAAPVQASRGSRSAAAVRSCGM